ncbi:MAG: lytic murein transglycosylase [Alphaproteobacteria bacterium]|nr:lytic murein transglycosylase [Alphaproteobacteria bacterium]
MIRIVLMIVGAFMFFSLPVRAEETSSWEKDFRIKASEKGITKKTLDNFFKNVQENPKVIALDRKQPEFRLGFQEYLDIIVPEYRVKKGRKMFFRHLPMLKKLEKQYGIPPQYLIAFWGMETNFGKNKGDFTLGSSLLTLAKDTRRPDFFQKELVNALKIMQRDGLDINKTPSSWAGAFGNFQFMPSTYVAYALDANKDKRINIISDIEDSFSSAANYLYSAGWRKGEKWGRPVILPADFPWDKIDISKQMPLKTWKKLGVQNVKHKDLPDSDIMAELVLPMGYKGPAFLVYHNFNVISDWNRSVYYALAVGYFADRLLNAPRLPKIYPREDVFSSYQTKELQAGLCSLGFYQGKIDGILGRKSRESLKNFQRSVNLPADGYADRDILDIINKEKAKKEKSFACEN